MPASYHQPGRDVPERSSLAARIMLVLFLFALLVQIAGHTAVLYVELTFGSVPTMMDPFTGAGVNVYDGMFALALGGTVAMIGAAFLLTALPVAIWIYRAHANLRDAGVSGLAYSPGWAVGSFFVPLVNLVVPFRAMRELHNRSHGEDEWQAHAIVPDVSSWWTCLLAGLGVMAIAGFVAFLATIPNLYVVQPPGVNTGLFLFSMTLLFGSAIFLFRVIDAVTKAQRQALHIPHAMA